MAAQERPYEPSLSFRVASILALGLTGFVSRSFLYVLSTTETHGLDRFLGILDRRKNEAERERGLITVSNHLSVLDDPMIWGVLPFRYHWTPKSLRWSLGSYDICFKNGDNGFLAAFLTYGQTLPTQRSAHSKYGGLFQPTMTEAVRLLSDPHNPTPPPQEAAEEASLPAGLPTSDPFSTSELTYTTNGIDSFPAPSAYPSRRFSWIHVFPEGKIHQHPQKIMRYFKWGVARLILEAEPCPDVVAMWIDGPQEVMNEKRTWPRPIPRPGKAVTVTFGEPVDVDAVFGPFRRRWQELKAQSRQNKAISESRDEHALHMDRLGELCDDDLKYGKEAQQLRIDVTLAVRNEVLKVRRARGLPDEDPKGSLAETWRQEGRQHTSEEGEMDDQSIIKDM